MRKEIVSAVFAGALVASAIGGTAWAAANPNTNCVGAMASNQQEPGDASGEWGSRLDHAFWARLGHDIPDGQTTGGMFEDGFFCLITS